MGIHSANPALVQSQVIDPLRPEVLLYMPKEGGGFRLIGVEYLQPVPAFSAIRRPAPSSPWMAQTPWPSNYTVVTPTPQLFGQTFQGPMPDISRACRGTGTCTSGCGITTRAACLRQWNPAVSCPAH